MKTVRFMVALLMFSGIAHAQDVQPSRQDARTQAIFSADRLAAEVARVQKKSAAAATREPLFTKEKLSRPTVVAGLGLMVIGAVLTATSSETVTMTIINPGTGLPVTSTISAVNNGRRWVGIGMLGTGTILTFLGLSE
ncbi:MAG TPA: hypothetical protein VGF24_31910 [Vicinamibacterales bacterium]|jgi:hypothetical protein